MPTSFLLNIKRFFESIRTWVRFHRFLVFISGGILACMLIVTHVMFGAPQSFPAKTIFTVEKGASLEIIASDLASNKYIRHPALFKFVVKGILRGERKLVAGDYEFEEPLNTFAIASRIVNGRFNIVPIKVTIPEGLNKFEIGELIAEYIDGFDVEKFVEIAPEGYLFPDTYFFAHITTPERVVGTMTENFWKQVATIEKDVKAFGRPIDDVIAMASIVELEARKTETRKTVAGVLWNRVDQGMPLQVDVSFKYINGKTTKDLTLDDLDIDSPYNSYRYKGLPPTPITNPGLDAIVATIQAPKTDYLFFLSDENGVMHFATTFDQHKKNKERYLY